MPGAGGEEEEAWNARKDRGKRARGRRSGFIYTFGIDACRFGGGIAFGESRAARRFRVAGLGRVEEAVAWWVELVDLRMLDGGFLKTMGVGTCVSCMRSRWRWRRCSVGAGTPLPAFPDGEGVHAAQR